MKMKRKGENILFVSWIKKNLLFFWQQKYFVHITLFYFIGRRGIRNDFIVSLKLQFVNHRKLYDAKFSQASFGHGILRHSTGSPDH